MSKDYRIHFIGSLPKDLILACSGGCDSMAVLDFLLKGHRNVHLLHINHDTEHAKEAELFMLNKAVELELDLTVKKISAVPNGKSKEAYWHTERYAYFKKVSENLKAPVITCHHLDDQVENWIMTAATGNPVLIPYANEDAGVIRPFILTRKFVFRSWCERHSLEYIEDPSNQDTSYLRNITRHEVLPAILKINPGIHKVIKKKIKKKYNISSGV